MTSANLSRLQHPWSSCRFRPLYSACVIVLPYVIFLSSQFPFFHAGDLFGAYSFFCATFLIRVDSFNTCCALPFPYLCLHCVLTLALISCALSLRWTYTNSQFQKHETLKSLVIFSLASSDLSWLQHPRSPCHFQTLFCTCATVLPCNVYLLCSFHFPP